VQLRHLRAIVALADSGSFAMAARRLHVAQPALSRTVQDLERELGGELIERRGRGIRFTPAGDAACLAARRTLDLMRASAQRARLAAVGGAGPCTLAASPVPIMSGEVATFLARLHAEYPGVECEVRELELERQWDAISAGQADLGLGSAPPPERADLVFHLVRQIVFDMALVKEGHRLARRRSIRVAELGDEPLLWHAGHERTPTSEELSRALVRARYKPTIRRDNGGLDSIIAGVMAGRGWAVGSSALRTRLRAGMVGIPISDFKIPYPHGVTVRLGDTRPLLTTLIGLLRTVGGDAASRRDGLVRPHARRSRAHEADDTLQDLMEPRHLRALVATINHRSIGRGAKALDVTQPGLSRQIGELERSVGVPLLVREARGVTPTLAGESLYRDATAISHELDMLPAEISRGLRETEGRFVIATVPTPAGSRMLVATMRRMASAMPDVSLTVESMSTARHAAALRDGRVDLALGHAYLPIVDDRGVTRERLSEDTLGVALLPAAHPLATRTSIEARELAEMPFVFIPRALHPRFHDLVLEKLASVGLTPRRGSAHEGMLTRWAMVAAGRGWVLGSTSQLAEPPSGVVGVRISDFSLPWGLDLVYRSDESRQRVLALITLAREVALELWPGRASPRTR
jgi:DNA-binding transcriptional LysR family regulator